MGIFNSFLFMYRLTLGDFSTKQFMGERLSSNYIWLVFVAATFLLQITFLNMLIAIMADTFSHVMDNAEESSMKERISILNDFRLILRSLGIDSEFQYLFVLEKDSDSASSRDQWSGELNEIRLQFEKSTDFITERQDYVMGK